MIFQKILIFLISVIILLFLFVIIKRYLPNKRRKRTYYFLLKHFLTPLNRYQNRYLIKNFNKIIEPYYNGKIRVNNKSINISKTIKNEYSLVDKQITKDLINDLKVKNIKNNTINELLKSISKYIHLNGKKINYQDLCVIDVLNTPGNYFPRFHTDVEWNTFCQYDGFQIWILLEHDKNIKSRGNMFIMETDKVKTGTTLNINKNNLIIHRNEGNLIFRKKLKKYRSLQDLKPSIKYLDAQIGEVFLMNQNVYHISDPGIQRSSRRAINLRVIYNKKPNIKICNINNSYSKLWRQKYKSICDKNNCVFHDSSGDIRFKFK